MIQPFTSKAASQQNVAGAIFVDDSNRPFLFMIATQVLCVMPDSDLDSQDFGLSQDNDFCGSANAKFESCIHLRVYRLGENAVSHSTHHSVSAVGVPLPVTQIRPRRPTRAAIAAWHCVSSVNT